MTTTDPAGTSAMSLTGPRVSGREQDILALLGQGFSVAQISRKLYISESTAKRHIEEVHQKLGAGPPTATLGMRLRAHAEHAARTFGLSSHLEIDDRPTGLAPQQEEGMLRLGYEAITDAYSHAGADALWVDVRVTGPVVIRVEDDGTGPVCKRADSYRWRPLTDIAARHNVSLAIGPRASQGTVIEITAT